MSVFFEMVVAMLFLVAVALVCVGIIFLVLFVVWGIGRLLLMGIQRIGPRA